MTVITSKYVSKQVHVRLLYFSVDSRMMLSMNCPVLLCVPFVSTVAICLRVHIQGDNGSLHWPHVRHIRHLSPWAGYVHFNVLFWEFRRIPGRFVRRRQMLGMWLIATDDPVVWRLSVCLSFAKVVEWSSLVCGGRSWGSMEHCITWGSRFCLSLSLCICLSLHCKAGKPSWCRYPSERGWDSVQRITCLVFIFVLCEFGRDL